MNGLLKTAVLLSALSLAAGGAAPAQDVLVYGTTDKVTQMDPANAYDFHTWELFSNINESLLTYKPGTSDIVPGLAESYSVNPSGTEYTFKLRKGLKFTDGTPFTADAVKWTIDRVVRLKGDPSWLVTQFVKTVTVEDPYTVKFTLNGPTAFFPSVIAGNPPYYPLSPGVYPADKIIHDPSELKGGQLVGMGPYKITSFKRDEEIVFDANPFYYGKAPNIKRIISPLLRQCHHHAPGAGEGRCGPGLQVPESFRYLGHDQEPEDNHEQAVRPLHPLPLLREFRECLQGQDPPPGGGGAAQPAPDQPEGLPRPE